MLRRYIRDGNLFGIKMGTDCSVPAIQFVYSRLGWRSWTEWSVPILIQRYFRRTTLDQFDEHQCIALRGIASGGVPGKHDLLKFAGKSYQFVR